MKRQIVLWLGAAALWAGCGNFSQAAARDRATERTCNWYQKCGEIGPGKTHESRDACQVRVRSQWNDFWPTADCDGRIRGEDLDNCLQAVDSTLCDNTLDFFNTIFNRCSKAQVCRG